MIVIRLAALCLLLLAPALASAESCRPPAGSSREAPPACKPAGERLKPYEPEPLKAGARPGFIDLGGGTEIRVGGQVRMEYGTSR